MLSVGQLWLVEPLSPIPTPGVCAELRKAWGPAGVGTVASGSVGVAAGPSGVAGWGWQGLR